MRKVLESPNLTGCATSGCLNGRMAPLGEKLVKSIGEARKNASIIPGSRKVLEETQMANVKNSLRRVMGIDGAIGVALVDINDGLTLATAGGGGAQP